MGRIPKLVKERALKELKEQQMKQEEEEAAAENETHIRTASCSSTSDRSVENYDPNAMETGRKSFDFKKCKKYIFVSLEIDFVERETPPFTQSNDRTIKKSVEKSIREMKEETSTAATESAFGPIYLPDDFTFNESEGLTEQITGFLKPDLLQTAEGLAVKSQLNSFCDLNADDIVLIRLAFFFCFISLLLQYFCRFSVILVGVHIIPIVNVRDVLNNWCLG